MSEPHVGPLIQELVTLPDRRAPIKYSDLGSYKYMANEGVFKYGSHNGQRKLLLNEMQFYHANVKDGDFIIYAGSANCEHLPVLMDMYPKCKFLLIDPNYHTIDKPGEIVYVWCNNDVISADNRSHYYDSRRDELVGKYVRSTALLRKSPTLDDDIFDAFAGKSLKTDLSTVAKRMLERREHVFIIQDYFLPAMCRTIRESLTSAGIDKFYFITDIRSTMIHFGDSGSKSAVDGKGSDNVGSRGGKTESVTISRVGPSEMDIVWNNCLQIIFLKYLQPTMSMLKFHPPYNDDPESLKKYAALGADSPFASTVDDVRLAGSLCDFDYLEYCANPSDTYKYFPGDIYLQPWQPVSSSEVRLWVAKSDIDKPMIEYSCSEWEDRFYWYKWYRSITYHGQYAKLVEQLRKLGLKYDGCADCCIELSILEDCYNDGGHGTDIIRYIREMSDILTKYSGYSLAYNTKLLWHGFLLRKPAWVQIYFIQDGALYTRRYYDKKSPDEIEKVDKKELISGRSKVVPYEGFEVRGSSTQIGFWNRAYEYYIRNLLSH